MSTFAGARERIGRFSLIGRTLLVPSMHPLGSAFLAASFRAIGVSALVMETCRGLDFGRELTSGKECFPCQITLGDLVYHLRAEQERRGAAFSSRDYAYFMPEATGPCRFGMYNKFQRLVLDRFEEFREVPIAAITTADSYSAEGLVPAKDATAFRLMAFMAVIVADVLDRIAWRVRPYERQPGAMDALLAAAVAAMVRTIESGGLRRDFREFHEHVATTARAARALIDPAAPRRPRIGIVGEIYLRSHPGANQDLIRAIERYGGEVVDASIAEWLTFVTYCNARERRREFARAVRQRRLGKVGRLLRGWLGQAAEYRYLSRRRRQIYASALRHLDIAEDHDIHAAEGRLEDERHFSFDIGTESVLSIGGALEYVAHGCDGVVNVYPFTCMPGAISSAVLNPLLAGRRVPYLEAPYDGTRQPNRETAIQTFVWQAAQRREHRLAGC